MRRCIAFRSSLLALWLGSIRAPRTTKKGSSFFEKKIRPVLVERCYECHSSKAKKLEGSSAAGFARGVAQGGRSRAGGRAGRSRQEPADPGDSLHRRKPADAAQGEGAAAGGGRRRFRSLGEARRSRPARWARLPAANTVDIEAAKQRWPFTPPVEPAIPAVKRRRVAAGTRSTISSWRSSKKRASRPLPMPTSGRCCGA